MKQNAQGIELFDYASELSYLQLQRHQLSALLESVVVNTTFDAQVDELVARATAHSDKDTRLAKALAY